MDKNDINIDPLLTGIAKNYKNEELIGEIIFPRITVDNETGDYYVYEKGEFRIEKDLRTGMARANRVSYGMTLAIYGPLLEHSLEQGVTKREAGILGRDKAMERATSNVSAKIKLALEKAIADMVTNTSIVTQNITLSGTSQLSDFTNSDPFGVIQTALDTMDLTGINAGRRVIFMGYQVWAKLRNHPALINRLGTATTRNPITKQQAADLFEVDEIVVGKAKYDTAKQGQTPSLAYVWGKHIVVALLANPNADTKQFELDQINPGYTLAMEDSYVDTWYEDGIKTEFTRYTDFYKPELVAGEAMYLIKNAIA